MVLIRPAKHRLLCRALAGAAVVGSAFAVPAMGAVGTASADTPAPQTGTAVVTPLLKLLDFGATFGLPTTCQIASSAIGTAASQANAQKNLDPVLALINGNCGKIQDSGDQYLQTAIARSSQFNNINQFFNPAIAALASGVQSTGTDQASVLGPLGPTVAATGADIAFFEGS
jgi:hypothetical protein